MTAAFQERKRRAARDFLRSAVVVDDELRESSSTPDEPEVENDPTVEELPEAEAPNDGADTGGELDVDRIVRAFAAEGIVCAAIQPDPGAGEDVAVSRAIARADLVVLDWEISRDDGTKALGWLAELAQARSRSWMVVAVYTKSDDLNDISAQVEQRLEQLSIPNVRRDGPVVRAPGVVVRVIPKLKGGASAGGVTPDALPSHLIDAFAEATGGLLGNAALRGLSALREATLAILRAFDRTLDVGFAAQRVMLERPSDADDQAIALIAAEFDAALRAGNINEELDPTALREWLVAKERASDLVMTAELWGRVFKPAVPAERFEALMSVLTDGVKAVKVGTASLDLTEKGHRSAFELFDPAEISANDRFAHAMAFQSRYDARPPVLDFGTLLEGAESTFWLSLQPACDSVRLSVPTGFPLVPLTLTDQLIFDLVVWDGDRAKRLTIPTKFRDLDIRRFVPAATGQVVGAKSDETWQFTDADGRTYRYVGDLREPHAQRLAARFAGRLARLGLEESEWQRRSARASGD